MGGKGKCEGGSGVCEGRMKEKRERCSQEKGFFSVEKCGGVTISAVRIPCNFRSGREFSLLECKCSAKLDLLLSVEILGLNHAF